jgi:hypothetical protein
MTDSLRSQRWQDFRRRAEYAPESVYRHRLSGWEYIPVHPFGDEPDVLAWLGLQSYDCWSADAWWGIDGDATLLQSCIARFIERPPGLYAIGTLQEEEWVYLLAVLDALFVTRTAFEYAMARFAELGFPEGQSFQLFSEEGLIRLTDENFG